MVAVWVVVFPEGVVRVNVTLAPDVGVPPFETTAVIGTVLRAAKLEPGNEAVTMKEGGVITVTLAVPELACELLLTFAFTAYVPGAVPDGPPLYIATVVDCPGFRVTEFVEKLEDHPDGCVEARLKVLAAHPEESLLVTLTL